MRIYTKSGDKGETGLIGGSRVGKNTLRVAAIGDVDELNANLGLLRAQNAPEDVDALLAQIQNDLFYLGGELADPENKSATEKIGESRVIYLEKYIDGLEEKLPSLKQFILPGGTHFASQAHVSRAVCRRAERSVVALNEKERLNAHIIKYLNRLSDLLFMLARDDMKRCGIEEVLWQPQKDNT